jgi:hypothetical protein
MLRVNDSQAVCFGALRGRGWWSRVPVSAYAPAVYVRLVNLVSVCRSTTIADASFANEPLWMCPAEQVSDDPFGSEHLGHTPHPQRGSLWSQASGVGVAVEVAGGAEAEEVLVWRLLSCPLLSICSSSSPSVCFMSHRVPSHRNTSRSSQQ